MHYNISHSFAVGLPVRGDDFVDRTKVLSAVNDLFSVRTGNILVTGERLAGKTSLCLKLLDILTEVGGLLGAYMSMDASFDKPDRFTQAVLLHVIRCMAAKLFDKSYSDLLLDLAKPKVVASEYRHLLRLFELVRRGSGTVGQSTQKEIGASAIAQARFSETERREVSIGELSSFENLLLLDEVVTLLQRHRFDRFVLFVDEANKLTLEANASIVRDNLALFSSKGMQFVFVTTPEVVVAASSFTELFQRRIEIGPFDSVDNLRTLIQHHCRVNGRSSEADEVYSPEALEAIWRISKGFPFRIQSLCQKSLERTLKDERALVTLSDVLDVIGDP